MIVELFISAAQAACIALIGSLIYVVITNYLAVMKFKQKTPGIPVAPRRNLFNNHFGDLIYRRNPFQNFSENHAKLGKTFAWFLKKQPAVSTIDLDLLKRMVLDDPNLNINRGHVPIPLKEWDTDALVYVSDDQWRRIRRVYASALTEYKIKSPNVQAEFTEVLERAIECIEWQLNKADKPQIELNADDLGSKWSLDLTFTTLFKRPNNIDYKSDHDYFVNIFEHQVREIVNPIFIFGITFRFLAKVADFLAYNFHPTGQWRKYLRQMVIKQANLNSKARLEAAAKAEAEGTGKTFDFEKLDSLEMKDGVSFKRNIADYIVDRLYSGAITKKEYVNSTIFLFPASAKTNADAAAIVIFNIAQYPQVQEKLRESLILEGTKSEYLHWVILESLRLTPPANVGANRQISTDLYTSDGKLIPKGTMVFASTFLIHRLEEYWGPDASEFKPERWANQKNFHPCQYLAFGLGKRNCPGGKFGLEALKMLVHRILLSYKLERSPKSRDLNVIQAPFFFYLLMEEPAYVKLERLDKREQ